MKVLKLTETNEFKPEEEYSHDSKRQKEIEKIQNRMTELEVLIAETKKRLPAHSAKPPVMLDLLEYEDEYDLLLEQLNKLKTGR